MPSVTYCQNTPYFFKWFEAARPNDVIVYYTGELASAIELSDKNVREFLLDIKETVWQYAVDGKLYLFQKKLETGRYEYIAVKAGRRIHQLNPVHYYTRYGVDKAQTRVNKLRQEYSDQRG